MVPHVDIAIIGTGFSGLGMAIQLKKAGFDDFVLLERGADVGGVWRDNTYPGCACDVESHLYSFSFAPNPRWSHMFSEQAEIWAYLKDCAQRFGLLPKTRFQHEVKAAVWDSQASRWVIETSKGSFAARILISGMGALSEPAMPSLPGLERFTGKVFHSAQWDHSYDLTGRDVAVIGTGASAIQFIPQIQPRVAKLHVFQRTPPWIVPRMDRPLTPAEQERCAKLPLYQKLWRLRIYIARELLGVAFRRPKFMKKGKDIALRHMKRTVKDPALRAKLTPNYEMGCKRVLISNDYYPALIQSNVQVITEGIKDVRERSIVTRDGTEVAVDTIIFGTGFQVSNLPSGKLIRGKDGKTLTEAVGASPKAHLGTTFLGFPNFFMLQGPNTGLGHSSVVMIIEHQISHVVKAIQYMRRHKTAAIEPKPAALAKFIAEVDRQMAGTVWTSGGCKSWYLDPTGRNSTLWPSSVAAFERRVARFDPAEYAMLGSDPWQSPREQNNA